MDVKALDSHMCSETQEKNGFCPVKVKPVTDYVALMCPQSPAHPFSPYTVCGVFYICLFLVMV